MSDNALIFARYALLCREQAAAARDLETAEAFLKIALEYEDEVDALSSAVRAN